MAAEAEGRWREQVAAERALEQARVAQQAAEAEARWQAEARQQEVGAVRSQYEGRLASAVYEGRASNERAE
eukprot:2308097-Prymnesium_polylepis.1